MSDLAAVEDGVGVVDRRPFWPEADGVLLKSCNLILISERL